MEIIREIYKNVIEESKYMDCVNKVVEENIQILLKEEKEKMSQTEYEGYRAKIYQILAVAEEEAFLVGVHYGISLLLENCKCSNLVKNLDDF